MNNIPPTDAVDQSGNNQLVSPLPLGIGSPFPAPWAAPSECWVYMDKCSQILCFVCRFDGKNGKTIRPLTLWKKPNGDLFWDWKALPTPRPLYHLDRLAANPDARVLVVEGEKTAEAAARLFPDFVITTSPNGANAASKADWSPLKDRQIVIWPDNDKPGHTYAASVCRLAREAGASRITVVKVPSNFPPNWDLADPLPEGYVMDDLRRLTDEALEPSNDQLEAVTTIPIKWFQNITPMVSGIDLIEGFMGVGQSSVIFGAANSSKTFLALDLALHIASGRPWFGRQVEPGGVIFVAAEGSFGISNRIEAFRRHHGIGPDVALPFAIVTSCPNLGSLPNDTKAMIATIQEASAEINGPVRLVVIDTLSRALAGGNENSSDDMGAIVTNADRIREETGAHVMFIHHSGKDATRGARGHSLLRAAIDTEIEVTRNETRGISCARITKQREFPIEDELVYRLEVVDLGVNPRGQPVTSCVAIPVNDEIDRSRAGQDRTISSGADRALSALRDCIAKHGQIVEAVPDVPPLLAVKQQEWHEELRKVGITDESKPDSERSLRSRYRKELVKSGIIGIFGDFVWLNGRDRIEVDEISGGPSEMKRDETPPVGGVSSRSQVTGVVSGNQSQQQSAAVPQGRSPYLPPPLLPPAFPPQAQPLRPLARWDETMHGRSKPLAVGNPPSAMPKPAENLPSSGMADKSGGISDDIDL